MQITSVGTYPVGLGTLIAVIVLIVGILGLVGVVPFSATVGFALITALAVARLV